MQIACFLFDGITALDIVGPYEVLQRLPEADVQFVAKQAGEIRTDNKFLALVADHSIDEITERRRRSSSPADSRPAPSSTTKQTLDWIRAVDANTTWTTSVCTGSMLLAAAGLLEGKEATSTGRRSTRSPTTARSRPAAASSSRARSSPPPGVSSGIDMGLTPRRARSRATSSRRPSSSASSTTRSRRSTRAPSTRRPAQIVELLANMYAGRV